MTDQFDQHAESLNDAFFSLDDDVLADELESAIAAGKLTQQRIQKFGITDERVIEQIEALALGEHTFAALSLVPLVAVAWADGQIQASEREALLQLAEDKGMKEWSIAFAAFRRWLQSPPPAELVATWKQAIKSLTAKLDGEQKEYMKSEFLCRAEQIAAAAGGVLRIGSVSEQEQAVLSDLAATFD
ncbi:MAG: hypothetical protein ACI9G1_001818 [Pirellulaceae bacterium]|jgi:hypothetical protein